MKNHHHKILLVSAILATVIYSSAFGQSTGVVPGLLSQLPPAPVAPPTISDIRIARSDQAADIGPQGQTFPVHALHITGATRFTEQELIAAAGFVPDRALGLSDLRQVAARITRFYNAHGYIVAQAYVPAQQINNGVVTVAVVEGHFGAVKLTNTAHLHDATAYSVLHGLNQGDPVTAAPLERRLLLLSDLPGVKVSSTLSPGTNVGTSDLAVDVEPGHAINGDIEASNAGSPYTGLYQAGGSINFNEPLGIGDVASLRVLSSGRGMQYGRASYQAQVGNLTIGAAYAYFHYRLGKQFGVLDAHGAENIASAYASYPLIRSYDDNLQARFEFDHRGLRDDIDAFASTSDRRADVVILGLTGDHHDRLGGGGWDVFSLFVSGGHLDIRTPTVRVEDAKTAQTQGQYGKLRYSFDRLQSLAGPLSLYGLIRGQVAFHNLDITEKIELGGAYGVRAYPEGEGYGDDGYIATGEARLLLPPLGRLPGRLQLAGFYDYGRVRLAHDAWMAGPDSLTRSDAGASLTWFQSGNFLARATYAFQLGPRATSYTPGNTGMFRFEIVKFF